MSGDLSSIAVHASWNNEGSADLMLSCRQCDWWSEIGPDQVWVAVDALIVRAQEHVALCRGGQPVVKP